MTDTATANGKVDEQVAEKVRATLRVDALRENGWKLELPDEQWAQLRDPATITEAGRAAFKQIGVRAKMLGQRVQEAEAEGNWVLAEQLEERQAAAVVRSDYAIICMVVESWSFSFPLVAESLPLLPGPVFDRLSQAAQDLTPLAFLDTSPSREGDSPFSDSSA